MIVLFRNASTLKSWTVLSKFLWTRASLIAHLVVLRPFTFDQVEVLDFCGPFEVFSVARSFGDPDESHGLFQAVTIAEKDRIITCYGGLQVKPQATMKNHPPLAFLDSPLFFSTQFTRHLDRSGYRRFRRLSQPEVMVTMLA